MNSLQKLQIYSDIDSEEDQDEKIVERLPVPKFCETSVKKSPEKEENEEGKIRNFPHERGNWATYVYLPVESSFEFVDFLKELNVAFKSFNLKLVDDFHVSLTRTVVLKHHWIEDFTDCIKKNLRDISCFKIHLCGLDTYCNEQKTRTFLSIKVDEGEENLKMVVKRLDDCLSEYNLPLFYKSPSFHISLFWCPHDKTYEISKLIGKLPSKFETFGFYMKVSNCICRSGNKNFSFNFQ